jgi:hypothetical protein
MRIRRKTSGRKNLLFLKKKKQKDFYPQVAAAPRGIRKNPGADAGL